MGARLFRNRSRLQTTTCLATMALLAFVAPSGSLAQDAEDAIVLDPLVVYGARNASTLNDTAASVGVVTAEEIETRSLGNLRDAFRVFGNVLDSDWVDSGFIIRGVNSEGLVPGGAPLASVYIDGIQQTLNGTRRGARGLWDVEQVEIYRGPQSTLTGRAALAGAIYIKTKDPTFEREAAIQGSLGSFERAGGAFMVNAPIIDDQVAFRIAGEYERSETDINYPTYQGFAGYDNFVEDEYYQIRGKVLITPKALPNTRALLNYAFAHDSPTIDDIGGPGLGFDFDEKRGDFNTPVVVEPRENDVHNAALEVTHDFSDVLRLTSLTTLSASDQTRDSINLGTPGETNVLIGQQEQTLATQELTGTDGAASADFTWRTSATCRVSTGRIISAGARSAVRPAKAPIWRPSARRHTSSFRHGR